MRLLLTTLFLLPAFAAAQDNPITEGCNEVPGDDVGFYYGELIIESPEQIAASYVAGVPTEGGAAEWGDTTGLLWPGITGEIVIARSPGGTFYPVDESTSDPDEACERLTNPDEVDGNIALIRRGSCAFSDKALRAQEAGAIGWLIYNDERTTETDHTLVNMSAIPGSGPLVAIPGLFLSRYTGNLIVQQADNGELISARQSYHTCYFCFVLDCDPWPMSSGGSPVEHPFEIVGYPNPFTHQTRFNITIDQAQRITARAYNALGQEVAVLHEGLLPAGTEHAFTFEAVGLAPGTYLIRVVGETFSVTRRVMLVR